MTGRRRAAGRVAAMLATAGIAACSSHDGPRGTPAELGAEPIAVSGAVSDGPVMGGAIYAYTARGVLAALEAADGAQNRGQALAGAGPEVMYARGPGDGDGYAFEIRGALAGDAVFFLFDNDDAVDEAFGDTPPNLESVAILTSSGGAQVVNVSLHTTLIAQIVRAGLDPDGDGIPVDTAAIASAIDAATRHVLELLGRDEDGNDLFEGDNPLDMENAERLHGASGELGFLVRSLASFTGATADEVVMALAADAGDGTLDGLVGQDFDALHEELAAEIHEFRARHEDDDYAMLAAGPCSTSAVSLRRACAADVADDWFEGRARCADTADPDARAECVNEVEDEADESGEECDAILDARLEFCAALDDAAHEPAFGLGHAERFVDPRDIGASVDPNPFWPLVPGTQWVYQGSFEEDGEVVTETVTVTVLDRIKLIDGVPCLVVNDVVVSDEGAMEDTNDWLAQDIDGNVWYCGEISRDFELFDGDDPEEFELVEIEGSWKHGRDRAKAGILMPANPEEGDVIRSEVLYGEAEDAIEIESLAGSASVPAAGCDGNCLVTLDFTPLEPEALENKYYLPGVGMILEVDLETGDRLELIEHHTAP